MLLRRAHAQRADVGGRPQWVVADAIDFLGDAGNYAIRLAMLGMAVSRRSKAAVFKAAVCARGVFVLGARRSGICKAAYR